MGAEFIDGEVIRFIKEQKHTLLVEGFEMGEYIGTNQVEVNDSVLLIIISSYIDNYRYHFVFI